MDHEEPAAGEAMSVLRGIWSAQRPTGADAGPSNAKVCRNMKNIGFGALDGDSTAGPVGDEQRSAWRERLRREGKIVPGATSLRDIVLGAENGR